MRKIGILEDDKKLGEELKLFLESNGYEARLVEPAEYADMTEAELVELLVSEELHLLLLDIGLPGKDGSHICKEYRAKTDSPVIMITSNNSELTELLCITNGADDFVPKPFNAHILLARTEAVLKRVYKDTGEKDQVRIETVNGLSFTIDYSKGTVSAGADTVSLSKNEIQILKILAKNHTKIVSRDDIMDALWDNRAFVDDNTLTVNMSRIKSKLESIGVKDVLITKRGMGYQLL
ncbi:MAG: response regulator transcription factor [Lachnospiraceae bacterium]|nr:response regulator transcription factor [Lachnospiraceae bacterium]